MTPRQGDRSHAFLAKPGRKRLFVIAFLAVASLAAGGVVAGCSSPPSFPQLSYDARHVPVPLGITFLKETHHIQDGPGFTSTHSEQVDRTFANSLPCNKLQRDWIDALRRADRSFRVDLEPRLFGSSGSNQIILTDRSEQLGITLGAITNGGSYISCSAPFIWSFNSPH